MTFDGGLVQTVKYGFFGKLPREVSRFTEWESTTVLRVQDLEGSLFDVVDGSQPAVEPVIVKMPVPKIAVKNKKKPVNMAGSVSGRFITDDELAGIPQFERLYREWVGPDDLMAGKFRVTPHDFAVAMVIMRHFKDEPNSDGTLPTRRAGELWTALYRAGDVERGWSHHRWKRIRDFISARGHIDWTDHRYQYGMDAKDNDGRSVRGIACKWGITDDFNWTLERVALTAPLNAGGASFVDTEIRKLIFPYGQPHLAGRGKLALG